eukprot:CAMPEP_0177273086 /NCGR_PEP_ID=MMETSP0367-20130122/66424_1 /TAXON_ID=447022 ORGANISM="Scrippsiella hangoei-like, Strain SHHI-4" /NCGR_SAMPLE_ID=MMETSP0367 /ASSEMBLY_ACC=CAM_ASM_000362 /LENGTH=146 /DNA_ID=CAMNT_0018729287 /DNA_START=96 /DNA_END=534 /DNA_ORIENTATION=+
MPLGSSLEQQARLAAGRGLATGVCFVHRVFQYRGVVVACEPWCTATAAWRQTMGAANLSRGETQPFHHCIVDDRDRPPGQTTFVSEENIVPTDEAFPVQSFLVDALLIPCPEIKGYLPRPRLEYALQRQRADGKFKWDISSEDFDV